MNNNVFKFHEKISTSTKRVCKRVPEKEVKLAVMTLRFRESKTSQTLTSVSLLFLQVMLIFMHLSPNSHTLNCTQIKSSSSSSSLKIDGYHN